MVSAISDVVTLFRKFYYQASYIVKKYYTIINGTPGMYIFLFCDCLENLFVKKNFFHMVHYSSLRPCNIFENIFCLLQIRNT